MGDVLGPINPKSRFCNWVKIVSDPFERNRGFSILGREFIVYGGQAVKNKVTCTVDNKPMEGVFYPIAEEEWLRVVPEMINSPHQSDFWFIPVEFCQKFSRPRYNKPDEYTKFGLENEEWAQKGGLAVFDKYVNLDEVIPERMKKAADDVYNAGLR